MITRFEYNCKIIAKLNEYFAKNPNMRFHQALQNLGIEVPEQDDFYEESEVTFQKITQK